MNYTPVFRLAQPAFNFEPWDTNVNQNWSIIDGLCAQIISVTGFAGMWANATSYSVGQQVIDPAASTMWMCNVAHTSAAAPTTFATDRTNNPTYWTLTQNTAQSYAQQAQTAATNAANSATSAQTQATNAASSAAAAAASAAASVPLAGGTMTGALILNADPIAALGAVTKQYSDTKLSKAGGLMTGPITLSADPTANMQPVTLQYFNAHSPGGLVDAPSDGKFYARNTSAWAPVLGLTGGTVTGLVTIANATTPAGLVLGPIAMPSPHLEGQLIAQQISLGSGGNVAYNVYNDGTNWRAFATGYTATSSLDIAAGTLSWYIAPSASAGAIATFVRNLTLNANGNLGGAAIPTPTDAQQGVWFSASHAIGLSGYYGANIYYGSGGWRAISTGYGWSLNQNNSNGNVGLQIAPSTVAGAAISGPNVFQFQANGEFIAPTNVWASGAAGGFGLQNFGGGVWGLRFSTDGWRLQWVSSSGILQYINQAGNSLWSIDSAGNFQNSGQIVSGTNMFVSGSLYVSSFNSWEWNFYVEGGSGDHIQAYRAGYYTRWHSSGGNLDWVMNNVIAMTLSSGGTLNVQNDIVAGRNLSTTAGSFCGTLVASGAAYAAGGHFVGGNGNTNFGMYSGSGQQIFQFQASWYWTWNTSNGDLSWVCGDGSSIWHMRQAPDHLVWNPTGTVGGNGAYANISDVRNKTDIASCPYGLPEILRMNPIIFRRLAPASDATRDMPLELGFSAQDMQAIIPEAVSESGLLPDMPDALSMQDTMLIPVLVNAVIKLNARVAALEAHA